jgi:hypothetical protein
MIQGHIRQPACPLPGSRHNLIAGCQLEVCWGCGFDPAVIHRWWWRASIGNRTCRAVCGRRGARVGRDRCSAREPDRHASQKCGDATPRRKAFGERVRTPPRCGTSRRPQEPRSGQQNARRRGRRSSRSSWTTAHGSSSSGSVTTDVSNTALPYRRPSTGCLW